MTLFHGTQTDEEEQNRYYLIDIVTMWLVGVQRQPHVLHCYM